MKNLLRPSVLFRYLRVCFTRPGLVNAVRAAMRLENPFGDYFPVVSQRGPGENDPTTEDFQAELGRTTSSRT